MIVREAILVMQQKGNAHSSRYRLRKSNGNYVWVAVFERFTKDPNRNAFMNLYYYDETTTEKATGSEKC